MFVTFQKTILYNYCYYTAYQFLDSLVGGKKQRQ